MKKLFVSPIFFYTILWILLFNPMNVQCAPAPVRSHFYTFKLASPFSKSYLEAEQDRHRVWLNLTNDEGLFKQILIAYVAGATNGWDHNYDAVTIGANTYADFYSINEDRKLVIQGRAVPFDPSDTIPLGYRSNIKGDLKISIDDADGDLSNTDIYLQDNQTGIIHNLKHGAYTFSTTTGTYTNRFVIRYNTDEKLGVDKFKPDSKDLIVSSKDKTITLQSAHSSLREVSVFDITGKLVYSKQKIGTAQFEISSIQSGTPILLIKTTLENGSTITKKILF
ncbi:T9SS sorting signal type C domain-containing protein [Flavobacterium reichenbachii]|uniref:Secretion system C-terminal sorting domain-containing protein n=1 Tax=Flavobacterium reichenbachii TaxID=362418 RepID=A0A085ZI37_9FLAO|nr:T9SS sorting signal type C domain-containing protein [Flavobacterium reichenbachii]KFF04101.1 hypothetical protein IW19_00510 [Flavobacterium reichenbachii]OXB15856.1 hypothetical protein B0A68_09350 [Flavobacterium reichenbachii]